MLLWRSLTSSISWPRPSLLTAASVHRGRIPLYNRLNPCKPIAAGRRAASFAAPQPELVREALFVPPGVAKENVTVGMVLPGSNIVVGPYAGDARIKHADFVKSSSRAKDCPKDDRPEFAVIGRSNVGKSSLINALVRQKDIALTSKKPGKTQLINHFLINKSWYIVDLPGYGFAHASESARMDWSSFTKGYFQNRDTLVAVLLLVDASIPPQQIDLDCANWLGRNNIGMTFVFTKCDKTKGGKGSHPADNIKQFQELIKTCYREPPPWIMTSSVTGLGRDELLLHMSQLRNFWGNNEE
ncbi:GTP-binding protein At2g22870 [Dendrobium catenatum]|uniref:GTP-binding protein At2g22870 n=1 Tax=Dendrobium catenatum TaxID=906689 RepID=UPI0009F6ADB5|nr:GTP-binding protein At2g22870 [Dendrobium catenatum]